MASFYTLINLSNGSDLITFLMSFPTRQCISPSAHFVQSMAWLANVKYWPGFPDTPA